MSKVGGTTTHYHYSADKTKLASRNTSGNGYDYLGSLEYKRTGGSLSLASASFDGGRIVVSDRSAVLPGGGGSLPGKGEIEVTPPATGGLTGADLSDVGLEAGDLPVLKPNRYYTPHYYLTDHLRSVRVIVDKAGNVKERNDYYAFGKRWENPSSIVSENKYLFNGKEKQPDFDFLDYGARMYDPGLGRWTTGDPLAENNVAHSLYAFCANNPVVNVDPDGQDWFRNDQGRAMWTESQESSFTDVEGVTWTNSGPSYLHQSRNGSAKYFYQTITADGSIRLASHFFTMDEMAIFRLFHSESAMMAAIEDHINPSFKNFLKMMAKEMAAQWTDPYLLAGGASVGVSAMGATMRAGGNATPNKSVGPVTGYTRHGLNQAIMRDGGRGVHPSAMVDAVKNPRQIVSQSGGRTMYVGAKATVVVNSQGKIITTYGSPRN